MSDEIRELRRRIEELEGLNRLAESVSNAGGVDDVLAAIIESSVSLCRADHVAILLFSPVSREAMQTLARSAPEAGEGIDHGLNLLVAGWVERHRAPLIAADVLAEMKVSQPAARWREAGPVLAVPLIASEKTIGVINMINRRGGPAFTPDAVRTMGKIAAYASRFIKRARLHETLFQDNLRLRATLRQKHGATEILGTGSSMDTLRKQIAAVAASSATVLLIGETGTGKELVARAIHFDGPRAAKPFVAINCAAIPATLFESELYGHERGAFTGAMGPQKGKFEIAHEGTLFLDEIAEMPYDLQAKLLRSLEERSFYRLGSSVEIDIDVRVIAASSRDLRTTVQEGKFREDLYHRLNVLPIALPPLRERRDDIPLLAQAFLEETSRGTHHFAPETLAALQELPWKGNVRELRNAVERLTIFVSPGVIVPSDLQRNGVGGEHTPGEDITAALQSLLRANEPGADLLADLERRMVQLAMLQAGGNLSQAARLLGIDRNALQRRNEKYEPTRGRRSETGSVP